MTPRVSVIIPAYNEGTSIVPVLDRLFESVTLDCEVLVVVDFEEDTTAEAVRSYPEDEPRLRLLVSTYGRGPANAIRFGIDSAKAACAVVTMADGCDDPRQIDELTRLVERGVVVAAASRYMPGGTKEGGPRLKTFLSRTAGRSLHYLTRIPTHDATNAFRLYRTEFLRSVEMESRGGFELTMELTVKAYLRGRPVAEVPASWRFEPPGEIRLLLEQLAEP